MTLDQWNTTTDPRAMVEFIRTRRPESLQHLIKGLSGLSAFEKRETYCDAIRLSVPFPGRVRDVQSI